ncbi:MAG TPA: HAMP domain-containing sensor histidine kinase [Gaiellaceae bacterium]|jgi:signal transduction histidine kinase
MTTFALITIPASLVASAIVAFGVRRLPTVRLQLAALAVYAAAVPLAAVTAAGLVMMKMHEDLGVLYVAAACGATALVVAFLLGRSVAGRIERLVETAGELASGDLAARAPQGGPAELARLGRSLNEMAASLEEVFDARRELVAWASHDLRTPVAAIRAMLEAIEDGVAAADEYLPVLRDQTVALGAVIDDLFELARIDAGVLSVELERLSVGEVVVSCVRALEADAQARHVDLRARVDRGLPAVAGAPEHVRRVLWNLLANALRHTPSDGSVVVFAEPVGDEVHIGVEDSGVGLSAEAEKRMFERFWRGDPARSRADANAGLGLAIARGLVEAQGGRIWAENRRGGGARVAFALPLAGGSA